MSCSKSIMPTPTPYSRHTSRNPAGSPHNTQKSVIFCPFLFFFFLFFLIFVQKTRVWLALSPRGVPTSRPSGMSHLTKRNLAPEWPLTAWPKKPVKPLQPNVASKRFWGVCVLGPSLGRTHWAGDSEAGEQARVSCFSRGTIWQGELTRLAR